MAFFGVTALGPQNPFRHYITEDVNAHFLDRTDIIRAFTKCDEEGEGVLPTTLIPKLCREAYYGLQPPQKEVEELTERFSDKDDVTENEWIEAYTEIKERIDATFDPLENSKKEFPRTAAREMDSINDIRDMKYKHSRYQVDPQEKYREPILTSQHFGWDSRNPKFISERFPKASTELSQFAHAMVKDGRV